MELHTPKRLDGSNKMYCGAAALCAITGEPYETVRAAINNVRDRKHNQGVLGMYGFEVIKVLSAYGYISLRIGGDFIYEPRNLNQYLKGRDYFDKKNVLLIELSSHFVTVKGDMLVDNHTKIPVHIAIAPWKRCKVRKVWVVKRRN